MSTPQKETIYVDIDDEITGLIDKVNGSNSKIVALVLPKRAAVLQSIVNMKLLRRTADENNKRVVLITSEAALMPLAGAVGMYVAKTLQSKPLIPAAPIIPDNSEPIDATLSDDIEEVDAGRTVGELAGSGTFADEETIEIDNDEVVEAVPGGVEPKRFNKKLKVPNFERFRLVILLGGFLLIVLIGGLVYALNVLPKARITIKTDTSTINSDISLTAATSQKEVDVNNMVVPAVVKELKKTDNEKAAATGQKDVGEKAKGTVTIYNCNKEDKLEDITRSVPAGTGISSGGLTFILQTEVEVEPSSFSGNTCSFNKPAEATVVVAQNAGDKYNLSERKKSYTVAGFSSMSADGSVMVGGTTKIVKVVSQQDVDTAKLKLVERVNTTASDELKRQLLNEGLFGVNETLLGSEPVIKSIPSVGDEASDVIVSAEVKYTVTAIKRDDLQKLIEKDVESKIDKSKQDVLENGLDQAVLKLDEKRPNGQLRLSLQAVVVAGPRLDADAIKRDIAGKKRGQTQTMIQSRPGIKEVTIDYSPWFVHATPKKAEKITIVFENSDGTSGQ